MDYSKSLLMSVVAGGCFAGGAASVAEDATEKPNIVVFLVDDMGVMDTSLPFLCGRDGKPEKYPLNEWYRTPNMQRLAERGIRFSTFYAQSVCSPTRSSIMTGQNATRHGTTNWINPFSNNRGKFGPPDWNWGGLKKDTVTLPKVLSAAGYETIHVGKAHFGPLKHDGSNPLNVGFDENVGGACWGRPKSYFGEDYYGNHPKYKGKDGKKRMTHNVPGLDKYYGSHTFLTEALTLEAEDKIAAAVKAKKPFYLYMAHYAVHAPFSSDPRFAGNYANKGKSKWEQAFSTMIEGMDKSLGDILDKLDELGIAENTLVLFMGDNGSDAPLGPKLGNTSSAPLKGKKGTCYEGGMRVPFIAAWAKQDKNNPWQKKMPIPQGAVQNQLGTVMDVYPTVLDLLHIKNPVGHAVDGYSLAQQLEGGRNPNRPDTFLMHFPHPHNSNYFTTYRSGDWKLIYHYNPEKENGAIRELYNLKNDPFEADDLASVNPEKLKQMTHAMIKQLDNEHALYPIDKAGNEIRPVE